MIKFTYSKEKDIWCLLNKGKKSSNSPHATKVYQLLEEQCGENPTTEATSKFIDDYLAENNVSLEEYIQKYLADWSLVSEEYHRRARAIFDVTLPSNVTAYLTVNNRNPYSISDNLFYVSVPRDSIRKTIMHELWHFYTWYGLGTGQEEMLGKQKYNDIKESLTVLLNEECSDLLPKGVSDDGYLQHQELRNEIITLWREQKDVAKIWNELAGRFEVLV